jgi:hypothetical protein
VRRFLVLTLAAAIVGCGSDSTTAPDISLSGRWTYSATNLTGSGIVCNVSGVIMNLTQNGTTITGTVSSGTVTCTGPGGTDTENLGNDVIANGQINGTAVQFDIGTSDVHNVGTLNGNSISGAVTLRIAAGTTIIILSGNFSAVKS